MDTEFVRVNTYRPQMGTIQARVGGVNYLIDPVHLHDFKQLITPLRDKHILKVFHAAFQDMELLYTEFNTLPAPLFDTQIGAAFLGFGISVSFETLVDQCCGKTLDKSSQFTDWTQRPLSQKQMDYAIRDVHYLEGVYDDITQKLKEKGYYDWAREEMKTLENSQNYEVDLEQIWRRAKPESGNRLFLARLREVAKVREALAIQWDIPRSRVLSNEMVNRIAHKDPQHIDDFLQGKSFSQKLKTSGIWEELSARLHAVEAMPPERYPTLPRKLKISNTMKETLNRMKETLALVSQETGIAPSLVAKSKDIEAFVRNPNKPCRFLEGWRHEVFGKKAIELL